MNEEYRVINGFENYSVSNFGNVKNNKTSRVLKPGINSKGLYNVNLCFNQKPINKKVHKLVADAFLDNPNNKSCVSHINSSKLDNAVKYFEYFIIGSRSKPTS